ncbi:MAG: hypothetical protein IJV62_02870 [Eggerthellaceae bacterium]|nr:hypothetical protein [Eggerthellaceae bacterium]
MAAQMKTIQPKRKGGRMLSDDEATSLRHALGIEELTKAKKNISAALKTASTEAAH